MKYDLDPYRGPTEDEALEAMGTSREEIENLAEALGVPSGLEDSEEGEDPGGEPRP